ncbi:MAG: prepilin-type N-terminal cleavage/methylation domain-containing protein [Candidatus Omnitrophica bacterium]|nr:prepilin-type N-terminal cleavage/methylation domain-containing protein [Candidatus Omnitrophota bacterium]
MPQSKGFTLIELFIVVIILGILVAIAIPTYVKTIEKGRAGEALSTLRLIQVEEKRFFARNGSFAYDINDLEMEDPNGYSERYFEYSVHEYLTDPPNFEARAERIPSKSPLYIIHKDGVISGPM